MIRPKSVPCLAALIASNLPSGSVSNSMVKISRDALISSSSGKCHLFNQMHLFMHPARGNTMRWKKMMGLISGSRSTSNSTRITLRFTQATLKRKTIMIFTKRAIPTTYSIRTIISTQTSTAVSWQILQPSNRTNTITISTTDSI